MALCGAGCMGFVNNALGVRALGYLEPDPLPDGGVSLVTHSGSAFSTLLRARRGFGFRLAVSSGQELVTDAADYVDYALDDPGTRIVGLLLEAPRAVPRLRKTLRPRRRTGRARGDPHGRWLAAGEGDGGRTLGRAGRRARGVAGVLRGDRRGARQRSGRVQRHSRTVLAQAEGPSAGGIATVHDSGAERALVADLADELGVEFADLAPETLTTIGSLLDDGLAATNPLDVWGTGADTRNLFGACLRAMVDDPAVAVTVLAVDLVTEYDGDTAYTDAVIGVAKHSDAPIAVMASVASAIDRSMAERLRDSGIPVLEGARSGLAALGHLARWPLPVEPMPPARPCREVRAGASAFELLTAYGIPAVQPVITHSLDEALAAAGAVGYPVALKTSGALHKTDVDGIVLNVADEASMEAAYTAMAQRLGPAATVEPMVEPGVEISVGIVRDASFGPLLIVAAGGTLVELLEDRVVACPPVSHAGALALLDRLRIRPLLAGWRGAQPVDIDALARVIVAFSDMAVDIGDEVEAVEANPVIASPRGVVAVDALLISNQLN